MGELSGRRPHILLVEDNPGDVELLRLALQGAGLDCELTVIEDGGEALNFIRQQRGVPDLAILDLNVPKNDGLEILEAMRASRVFADVPVAVMSSSSWTRERAKLERFRISRYITKPPDLDEFMKIGLVIKELLSQAIAAG